MNVDFDRLSFVRFAPRKQPTDGVLASPVSALWWRQPIAPPSTYPFASVNPSQSERYLD